MISKKHIVAIAAAILLASCEDSSKNVTSKYAPSEELSGCTITNLISTSARDITVVRCPISVTSAIQYDKARTTTVTVDGNEYVRKE